MKKSSPALLISVWRIMTFLTRDRPEARLRERHAKFARQVELLDGLVAIGDIDNRGQTNPSKRERQLRGSSKRQGDFGAVSLAVTFRAIVQISVVSVNGWNEGVAICRRTQIADVYVLKLIVAVKAACQTIRSLAVIIRFASAREGTSTAVGIE